MVQELRPPNLQPFSSVGQAPESWDGGQGRPSFPRDQLGGISAGGAAGPGMSGSRCPGRAGSLSGNHQKYPQNLSAGMGGTPSQVHRSPQGGLPTPLLHRLR